MASIGAETHRRRLIWILSKGAVSFPRVRPPTPGQPGIGSNRRFGNSFRRVALRWAGVKYAMMRRDPHAEHFGRPRTLVSVKPPVAEPYLVLAILARRAIVVRVSTWIKER